jgi:hypothetical protein
LAGCALNPTAVSSPTPAQSAQPESVAAALQAALAGEFPLDGLTIEYLVGIEAWGGATTLIIRGTGAADLTHSLTGEERSWSFDVTGDELLDLVRLLVDNEVWIIRGEREVGMPDEAHPNVIISAGDLEPLYVGMWDKEASEHPQYGPIIRELDGLVYHIMSTVPDP